jgi:hypothetical protein
MSSYLVKHDSNSVPTIVTFRTPGCGVVYGDLDVWSAYCLLADSRDCVNCLKCIQLNSLITIMRGPQGHAINRNFDAVPLQNALLY